MSIVSQLKEPTKEKQTKDFPKEKQKSKEIKITENK